MYTYYVAGLPYSDTLAHHGIKGQKWGIRRYQYPDGTLTPEGKLRYNKYLADADTSGSGFYDYSVRKLGKQKLEYAEKVYEKALNQVTNPDLRKQLPQAIRFKLDEMDKAIEKYQEDKSLGIFITPRMKKQAKLEFERISKIEGELSDIIMRTTLKKVTSKYGTKNIDDVYDFLRQLYGLQIYT